MCGLAGLCGANAPYAALGRMAAALAHRGPDGEAFAIASEESVAVDSDDKRLIAMGGRPIAGLAHRRLSIIDLSDNSLQPMLDPSHRLALAYNGELYNYVELRDELIALGHRFATTGDTEVVLRAYVEWGADCVRRFAGMWAFALIDLDRGELLLSRDRFGIKPLYWTRLEGGGVAFASEIKALRGLDGVPWGPDETLVKRYLLTGLVDEVDRTFFTGIERVPAATNLVFRLDDPSRPSKACFWTLPSGPDGASDVPVEAARLRSLLTDAVRIHLRSDVPVGTCLSGGIDSSGIVGLCADLRRAGAIGHYTHHAFGYVPASGAFSEEPYMHAAAERSGAELTIVKPSAREFQDMVIDFVRSQDEPFSTLSIGAQAFVFRAARAAGIKVMLDGQGADEIFAGYHGYMTFLAGRMLFERRILDFLRFAGRHQRAYHRQPIPLPALMASPSVQPLARLLRPTRLLDGAALAPGVLTAADTLGLGLRGAPDIEVTQPTDFHSMLIDQVRSKSLPALLRYEDRNSMAHSIEARVPYLDHHVAEAAFALPWDMKLRGVQPKYVLRRALADVLAPEILARRDKIGFRHDASATHMFARRHRDALLDVRSDYERDWIDHAAFESLLNGGAESEAAEYSLWRVVNVKLWLRDQFGDGDLVGA